MNFGARRLVAAALLGVAGCGASLAAAGAGSLPTPSRGATKTVPAASTGSPSATPTSGACTLPATPHTDVVVDLRTPPASAIALRVGETLLVAAPCRRATIGASTAPDVLRLTAAQPAAAVYRAERAGAAQVRGAVGAQCKPGLMCPNYLRMVVLDVIVT